MASLAIAGRLDVVELGVGEFHPWARLRAGNSSSTSRTSSPDLATITIANSVVAMVPGKVEQLLQLFQRVRTERVGNTSGHGFGLSIAGAIAQAHHAGVNE